MCGSWTKIAVLLKKKFGFIWDLLDVFTVHICSARAQIQCNVSIFKIIFCRFPGIFNENTTFEEICLQIQEQENHYNDEKKKLILTLIYWQISNEKYVFRHLICLL